MARYGDINRADELKAAKTAYTAWLEKSRKDKQAAYAANKRSNVGRQIAWIQPFDAPKSFYYEFHIPLAPSTSPTANEESASAAITAVIDAATTTGNVLIKAPTGAGVILETARKVQFARFSYTLVGESVDGIVSRITNNPYSYRKSDSVSSAFGQNATSIASEITTRGSLRDKLIGSTPAGKRISFKPQGNIRIALAAAAASA